jgi:O-methyltransferase
MFLHTAKRGVKKLLNRLGHDLVPYSPRGHDSAPDIDEATKSIFAEVRPYTMTGLERVAVLCQAVAYVVRNNIPGDLVECGVWRGGSMMAAAKVLLANEAADRTLHLFDTFAGMPPPMAVDVNLRGENASELLDRAKDSRSSASIWAIAPLDAVRSVMHATGYDPQRIKYVVGRVEDTLPAHAPERIALLRLDTDWYESTYHELVHLYPRLSVGGVLIIDDYGHWQGCRKAVDEYFADDPLFLFRIDYTGRMAVRP